jgi:hypothetical protein
MKLNLIVLYILLELTYQIKAQNIQILDAFMDIKCLDCDIPAKDNTKFQLTMKCRFAENSAIPKYAFMPFNDTVNNSPYLYLLDSVFVNCQKYYS